MGQGRAARNRLGRGGFLWFTRARTPIWTVPMILQLSTWPEVEAYLGRSTGIIIPIGSTEQHGPIGLIGTDTITAEAIARGAGAAADALVAPVIPVGMAEHHMAFPGSMTLRPSTLIAVIVDTVTSLARHGFTRFLFINGHGGNIATIQAAFYETYNAVAGDRLANAPDLRCKLMNWWEAEGVIPLSKELYGQAEGSHATPSEVAVTWHLHPDAVRSAAMTPEVAPRGGFFGPEDFRRRYPDGRIGSNPALATPAHGRRIFDTAVAGVAAAYREFATAA